MAGFEAGHLRRNKRVWNQLADGGSAFAKVASDEECSQPLKTLDSRGWLPDDVRGWRVLCLASGGGWQSILYAAAGAEVTVVDLSSSMLKLDHQEAEKRGLSVRTVDTSMDDLSMFSPGEFDIVHQPVSSCYIPDIAKVYGEIARVLKVDGLYISQHKQPTSLQITHKNSRHHYVLGIEYYQEGVLPVTEDTSYREAGADEYLHRWEQLVGELCRAGFVLEDLVEPVRADKTAPVGHYRYRGRFVAPYVRLKARRINRQEEQSNPVIWTP